jgi:hypothetical protein
VPGQATILGDGRLLVQHEVHATIFKKASE